MVVYLNKKQVTKDLACLASKIAQKKGLDEELSDKLICFEDPFNPKECLAVPYDEEINKLFDDAKVDFDIVTRADITTIRVGKMTVEELGFLRTYHRESLDSVINRLIKFWNNAKKYIEPMEESMKKLISSGLEKKFGVPVVEIEDLGHEGTIFHLEGDPKGTPVLIPNM